MYSAYIAVFLLKITSLRGGAAKPLETPLNIRQSSMTTPPTMTSIIIYTILLIVLILVLLCY